MYHLKNFSPNNCGETQARKDLDAVARSLINARDKAASDTNKAIRDAMEKASKKAMHFQPTS